MAKEKVEILIEGGKATAAPPLGPALGPMGVNIGEVVTEINKVTASFKGMQVPVIVTVDTTTKDYEIKVGTPPASALIKKEAGVQKASKSAEVAGNLTFDQVLKIADMKKTSLLGVSVKQRVKDILGTCNSMGITVDSKDPKAVTKEVNEGVYDEQLKE
ncbi:MAG: 50S ribosomal protein L11 [Nanobdellota archaeon]